MLDQSVFTETIHEVAEIIRTSATPLSKEEILSYFKEMELNEQQENMVLEFLLTPHEEEEAEEETEEAEGGEQEAADWQETSDASVLAQNDPGKKEEKNAEPDVLPETIRWIRRWRISEENSNSRYRRKIRVQTDT